MAGSAHALYVLPLGKISFSLVLNPSSHEPFVITDPKLARVLVMRYNTIADVEMLAHALGKIAPGHIPSLKRGSSDHIKGLSLLSKICSRHGRD